jgi:tight adherence protein C
MVSTALTLLFGLAVAGACLTLLFGLLGNRRVRSFEDDRMYFASMAPTLEEVELSQPFGVRVVKPIVSSVLGFLGRLAPQRNLQDLRHKLEVAGRPYGWGVVDLMGLRLLSALLFGALIFALLLLGDLSPSINVLFTAGAAAVGFYLPNVWLSVQINRRKATLLRALPDGLDMLNICVGAGLGFDAALGRIGDRWQNSLSDEFNRVVTEIQLGKGRRQALLDLASRTDVPEIENFVAIIIQAQELGVSIARVLRTHAEQMRTFRRQRAEERARQATIQLLFPLVFLIFPSMLAVLLGPAIPQLLTTLGSLIGR